MCVCYLFDYIYTCGTKECDVMGVRGGDAPGRGGSQRHQRRSVTILAAAQSKRASARRVQQVGQSGRAHMLLFKTQSLNLYTCFLSQSINLRAQSRLPMHNREERLYKIQLYDFNNNF